MAIVGDSKAYIFLKKHGALVKELPNKSVTLTLDGRVYILTFLLFYDYLTKDIFNEIATLNETQPALSAYTTGKMLRFVCEKWLKDHKPHVEQYGLTIVPHTDLTYRQVALLFELLVAAQENLERHAEGRKAS